MALQSHLFRGDALLDACLLKDAAHIRQGARGVHVAKIQAAVTFLDGGSIDRRELSAKFYGPQTASVVLAYKRKRKIINRAYQTQADDIVGRMTIAALDKELLAEQEVLILPPLRRCARPVKTVTE